MDVIKSTVDMKKVTCNMWHINLIYAAHIIIDKKIIYCI